MLVQAAWAATRKNGSYLQSQFRRVKGRRGPKKAIVAVAASMLTAAYFMLRDEKDYHDLGSRYLADRDKHRVTQDCVRAGSFTSVAELVEAIAAYLACRNESPKPYKWKADGAKTLAKIQRAREALEESLHG